MALETWLTKVKSALRSTTSPDPAAHRRRSTAGILAFEITGLMAKLLHLWRSLSDAQIYRLRHDAIALEGVRKVVSDDDAFLLGLACAELVESLRLAADSLSTLSARCADPELRRFGEIFRSYADSGEDPNRWAMGWREMEAKAKKMDRYVAAAAALYREMDELAEAEQGLRKLLQSCRSPKGNIGKIADVQQKILWQRQEVKYSKETSLWACCSLDGPISLLARSSFTVLARIKHVFGINHQEIKNMNSLPRSLSVSAVVYPSSETPVPMGMMQKGGLFEVSSAMVAPPPTTLGAAALASHYANVIVVIEKMIATPRAVGPDARDDLYAMLPGSVRGLLRSRLRGVGWGAARDAGLAGEWRAALDRIVEWLGPVAHNTVRWQGERSFERRSAAAAAPQASVLMLQTLYFANREKVEAAIAELLVGLNYVWRFEMEMGLEL